MADPNEDTVEHRYVFDDDEDDDEDEDDGPDSYPDGNVLAEEPVVTIPTDIPPRGGQLA